MAYSYCHGGDIETFVSEFGAQPIDLSANINPFGVPEAVRAAMHRAVDECAHYPDPFCRAARQAVAEAEGIPADMVYCGNGAADVLDRLAAVLRPKRVLLTAPTFAEYERTLTGAEINFHMLRESEDFAVTERLLSDISSKYDAVYLCNPNNPTGRTAQPELMRRIVQKCAENSVYLIADECFNDFLLDAEQHSLSGLLEAFPCLILLRAYTKMFAVPGVRFGWCMTSDRTVIDGLYRAGQPWNVSVIAQACAEAAAKQTGWREQTARRIAGERAYLADGLHSCGVRVYPGEANFLLFRSSDEKLDEKLRKQGIMIRNCSNYRGLGPGFYRTAVKTRDASEKLLHALRQIQEI